MPKNSFALSPTKTIKFTLNSSKVKPTSIKTGRYDLKSTNDFLTVPNSPFIRRMSSPKPPHKQNLFDVDSYHTICTGNSKDFNTCIAGSQAQDWLSLENSILDLFNKCEGTTIFLPTGALAELHEHVKNLLESNIGSFVYDRFKSKMLCDGMLTLVEKVKTKDCLIQGLCQIWECFFSNVLPTLDCILYRVKTKNALSIRQTTLVAFRDEVVFKTDFEHEFKEVVNKKEQIQPQVKHMLLTLQNVNECYPPSKNKLRLEALTALIISPYLGYEGLYVDSRLIVPSNEPAFNARRKSYDANSRKHSRPLSVQPHQLETLNQLFINAVRKN